MPDKRAHRGPHPADRKFFGPEAIDGLRAALADFCMLLSKGYAEKSALKLVGDRYSLTRRQRLAVMRSACSDEQLESRRRRRIGVAELAGAELAIDGYNLLITIEAAMSGGIIFRGRDRCLRDLASIHGTYRRVSETIPAVELIGRFVKERSVKRVVWLLDSPVSNSGRLKTLMGRVARERGWSWEIQLMLSPDAELTATELIVASSDGIVLDGCKRWVNLAAEIIESEIPSARIVDLGGGG